MFKNIQLVAFDLDGTLVDSIPDLAAAANAMRVELGLSELPREVVQGYVGDGVGVLVHRSLTASHDGVADEHLWQQGLPIFMRHYAHHIAHATRPYPETEVALDLLKQLGLPLVVVTNKNELLATKLLKELNLVDYFSMVVGGDTLPEKKPSPAPLLHVAEVFGVAPEQMLMVGDSHNDFLAAKAAGCPCVGVSFGYGDVAQLSRDLATKPDWIVDRLVELDELLREKSPNVNFQAA